MATDPRSSSTPAASDRRPPKAWHTLRLLLLLAAVAAGAGLAGHRYGDRIAATVGRIWQDATGAGGDGHAHETGTFYTCGMHPWVILPAPGLCPICHMDLTPLDPAKFTGEIAIDPVVAQNIGVRTAAVEAGPLVATVRTVGRVDYDETSLHDVDLRVGGWIEHLHVDSLGAAVERGQPLFELYSPELYSAQQDYVLALRQRGLPGVAHLPQVAEDAASTLAAARARLANFGVDAAQIEALERTLTPQTTMLVNSPVDGTVIRKTVVAGMRVDSGMQTYRIADLTRVWVTVAVYEYQLPFVELGQEATMTLSYVPGHELRGKVAYVYPWTDDKTRQVNVRIELDNTDGLLKPGMFVNVELRRTLAADRTLVSRSAVIDTGERQVAFVSLGSGRFEPRALRLGIEADGGMVEVIDGLVPGERVVTSAQFLLDSESRIRDGLLRMIRGDLVGSDTAAAAGPELPALPTELAKALATALDSYLEIAGKLAGDTVAGIAAPAHAVAAAVDAMLAAEVAGRPDFWQQHDEAATVRGKALEVAAASDLGAARLPFYDLSVALAELLRATGVPASHAAAVEELHCPMYLENQGGAIWLQDSGAVRNPYFGSKMLGCFDRRAALPRAGEAPPPASDAAAAAVDAITEAYLRAAEALAADRTTGLAAAWAELRAASAALARSSAAPVADLAGAVGAAVPAAGLDIAAARAAFANLSAAVIELLRAQPAGHVLERAYCPMVEASWLQADRQLRNPYMGAEMLECGSFAETLPARGGGRGR